MRNGVVQKSAIVLLLLLAGAWPVHSEESAAPARMLPLDNLAIPVYVEHTAGSGSGFFLRTADALYFVTAYHVVVSDAGSPPTLHKQLKLTSYGADFGPKKITTILDLHTLDSSGHVLLDAANDVAVVRMGLSEQTADLSEHDFVWKAFDGVVPQSGLVSTPVKGRIRELSEVLIGNYVFVFGYPTSIAETAKQIDKDRPLVRKGIVAGTNKGKIILHCSTFPGDSGGPVLQIEPIRGGTKTMVIGVVTTLVPFVQYWQNAQVKDLVNREIENSGYTLVTPMDHVLELIAE